MKYAGEQFTREDVVATFTKDARTALDAGDIELAERLLKMAERFTTVPPEVLHLKEFSEWNSGPHIRKCTECGRRLWLPDDGKYTNVRSVWESPPPGYVNCSKKE